MYYDVSFSEYPNSKRDTREIPLKNRDLIDRRLRFVDTLTKYRVTYEDNFGYVR